MGESSTPLDEYTFRDPYAGRKKGYSYLRYRRAFRERRLRSRKRLQRKSGVLFPVFSGSQKGWKSATHIESETIQSIRGLRQISNGNTGKYLRHPRTGRLDLCHRPEGRVPSRPDPCRLPKIPQICIQGQPGSNTGIPMESITLRTQHESQSVFQSAFTHSKTHAHSRVKTIPVYRRYTGSSQNFPTGKSSLSHGDAITFEGGICDKHEKITPRALPGFGTLGSQNTNPDRVSVCTLQQSSKHCEDCTRNPNHGFNPGRGIHVFHWQPYGMQNNADMVHASCQTAFNTPEPAVQSYERSKDKAYTLKSRSTAEFTGVLGEHSTGHSWPLLSVPQSSASDNSRCKPDTLRSMVRRPNPVRCLGHEVVKEAHKCERNASSVSSTTNISTTCTHRAHTDSLRQCQCSCLHLSPRRDALSIPQQDLTRFGQMVHEPRRDNLCHSRGGSGQLSCRQTVSSGPSPKTRPFQVRRMVPVPGHSKSDLPTVGNPRDRSICNKAESQGPNVLLQNTRPFSDQNGSPVFTMGFTPSIPLSPDLTSITKPSKDQTGGSRNNHDSAMVASKGMVSPSTGNASRFPNLTNRTVDAITDVARREPPPFPQEPPLSCLETQRESLETAGISAKAAETISKALRQSSKNLYHEKWTCFKRWCQKGNIHPLHTTPKHILDYLESLAEINLMPNTVLSHVSALSSCLPPMEGTTVGSLPLVTKWLHGYTAMNPPRRNIAPPWELNIVLEALREPPFEPLGKAEPIFLTWKTAFLIAITSARRVSELQALCAVAPYLMVNPRSVIMRINPSFLPKTATDLSLNGTIELSQFPEHIHNHMDNENRKNCPVRAITKYLESTKEYRTVDQFFVGVGQRTKGKAVTKRTIAGWISDTIAFAYARMGRDVPVKTNAHSTRGVAATWAEFAKCGLPAICQSATWSTSLSFAKHYRLDFAGSRVSTAILEAASK